MIDKVKTWVLLRGLTREHRHWEDFPAKLQQYFPGAQIITPDLPGNGDHADAVSPASIREMLHFLRKDNAAIIAAGPVHIIGLSMGAMVAVEWMKHYPEECAAGILMNTSLGGVSPFYHRLRPENYFAILYSVFASRSYRREKAILQMTSNLYPDTGPLLQRWVSYAEENGVLTANALRQLIAASRYHAPKSKPVVPILLLCSEKDNLVSPQSSASIAKHWSLPIEIHPTAGHDLTLDDGDWVCEKIHHWLAYSLTAMEGRAQI